MPASVRLSDDQEYLIYNMSDPLSMEELMAAYQEERRLRDSIPYTLSSIVDMREVRGIPRAWLTAKAGPGLTHPRSGSILMVGVSRPIMTLVKIIFSLTRFTRMQFFEDYAEAEARMQELIKQQRKADNREAAA